VSRREPAASRSSSSSRTSGARGARPRSDGKVNVACPQCAAEYRIAEEHLDQKIECTSCHRVFFAKTVVGKRGKPQDHTKTYVIFGVVAVAIIGILIGMSSGEPPPKKAPPPVVQKSVVTRGTHPRTQQVVKWAQSITANNQFVFETHSDVAAVAAVLGIAATEKDKLLAAAGTHESTRFLRELNPESAELLDDESMTAATGKAKVYVTPKPGSDDWLKNTRGEIEVAFRMDGEQIKVTGWQVTMKPARNPKKPDPSKMAYVPNKDIARPDEVVVTDSAGTRKVNESQPAAVPHWDKATPEQQAMADKIVADILASAAPDAPGGLFNRATLSVKTIEDKKAAVPRVLNAMFEHYADVTANNMKLNLLNKALVGWTGFAVNYQVEDTGDAAKDKKDRESCVRQWFAYWWRHANGELKEFFEDKESLEMPTNDPKAPLPKAK
jgi:hypothetical protein